MTSVCSIGKMIGLIPIPPRCITEMKVRDGNVDGGCSLRTGWNDACMHVCM